MEETGSLNPKELTRLKNRLNKKFGVPGMAKFVSAGGGLPALRLTHPSGSTALIHLQGANVVSFIPAGSDRDLLWLDPDAEYRVDRAIRGGIPIVFPWFGPDPTGRGLPQHGFARDRPWTVSIVEKPNNLPDGHPDANGPWISALFTLQHSVATKALWDYPCELELHVFLNKDDIEVRLCVENPTTSGKSFKFEDALHTYYAVNDARTTSVVGLDGWDYFDKNRDYGRFTQQGPVTFHGPVDRVFPAAVGTCVIEEAGPGGAVFRRVRAGKSGSGTTVVWNPGARADRPEAGPPPFVCVEAANVGDHAVTLAPGETHVMTVTIAPVD